MPEFHADQALVLSARRLGERSWITAVLTRDSGRLLGVYQNRRQPEPGTIVSARWRARLSEQLGKLYLEEITPLSARYLDDPKRLACLASLCPILNDLLPERQAFSDLYEITFDFLSHLSDSDFLKRYVLWEKALLSEVGFGLDLTSCAGGGDSTDLAYVSPKTGRAVSRDKGRPYHDKLLPLPRFLWQEAEGSDTDIQQGLILTGYFLTLHLSHHHLPIAREQLTTTKK